MYHSVRHHRWQPNRLPRPWDSPGKNTGVGCHFLLQCMNVKSQSEIAQSCLTLSNPMDCSLPDSSIDGIFQARVLEWVASALTGHQNWPGLAQLYVMEAGDLKIFSRQNCWAKINTVKLKRNQSTQVNYTKAGGGKPGVSESLGIIAYPASFTSVTSHHSSMCP